MTVNEKTLFVDDEQKVLNAITRQFDDVIEFETALGPAEALELLEHEGPFAVVVSDMRMPGMSGIEFLTRTKEVSPDTVRLMLTGYADLKVTIDAVNEGNIFRFLSKPCPQEVLANAVHDALAQYRLVTSERELLEGTLQGCVNVLSEMLSLANPLAFGRTSQVQRIALAMADELELSNTWDLKIATKLFPLGFFTVPEHTLEAVITGNSIPAAEQAVLDQHALIARGMLEQIPRLESVTEIVAYQDKCYDGKGLPRDNVFGKSIPLGARILKVATDFEATLKATHSVAETISILAERPGRYDPDVFEALLAALRGGLCDSSQQNVKIEELRVGMLLAADLRCINGLLLVTQGQEITDMVRRKLLSLLENGVIRDSCSVEMLGLVAEASPL